MNKDTRDDGAAWVDGQSVPPRRIPVELTKAYRLINHGPTVLVSTAHAGRSNVMAAAWNMPLDFRPPKVAVVIDRQTFTRELIEASGEFVLAVPTVALLRQVVDVGHVSGREVDKFEACGVRGEPASLMAAPLIDGCVAWLECKVLPEPAMAEKYDLFLGEVVAAWVDPAAFSEGRWHIEDDALRSLHHVAGGTFFTTGPAVSARTAPSGASPGK